MYLGFQRLLNLHVLLVVGILAVLAFYFGYSQNYEIRSLIEFALIGYMCLSLVQQMGQFISTLIYKWKLERKAKDNNDFRPAVTILVPAYNEGQVIKQALSNLMNLNYDNYEIIVIDDGSTDNTAAQVYEAIYADQNKRCRMILQENQGKSAALNRGVTEASGELIICVDADSILDTDSIRKAVRHFVDPRVGAVSGFVRVASLKNLLLRFQDLEYAITLNFARPALALAGAVTIVPGPAGIFRKDVLMTLGGYKTDRNVFAEDADLSIRMLAAGWRITSESGFVSYTEAPEDLSTLLRQRYRWNRGIIQALRQNIVRLFTRCGFRGKTIATYLIFDAYGIRINNTLLTLYFMGNFFSTGTITMFSAWFGAMLLVDALVISFTAKNVLEYAANIVLMFFSRISYGFILMYWGLLSLIDECFDTNMSWDKLERTGQITGDVA